MRRLLLVMALVAFTACADASLPSTTNALPGLDADGFPVIVVDATSSRTIPARPQRIVSLSATHTEMLYAIGAGDQIIGTDLTSDYPPAANDTAKLDSFAFNLEEVLALQPDLVIVAFDFSGEVDALEGAGIPALLLPPAPDLNDMVRQMELLGTATGNADASKAETDRLRTEINRLIDGYDPPERPLTFFHEVDETLFSVNSATFLGDIYRRFGLVNIADEAPDEFGSGFPQLSAEFVLESDPDLIFLGDAGFGVTAASVGRRPGWNRLTAVNNGAVFELDTDISGRWGPRTDQLVAQVAAALESIGSR